VLTYGLPGVKNGDVRAPDGAPGVETIGERLRRLRLERNLSQRELSSPGVSYAYISRIEAGTRQPSVKALRMLARKLNVSVEYLETGREIGDDAQRELRMADAELRLRLDDVEGAEGELRDLLAESIQSGDTLGAARAHSSLGFVAFQAGRHPEAIEHLEASLELLAPSPAARPDIYATLGQAFALIGRPERAVELFRRCLDELEQQSPRDDATYVRFSTYLSYALSDLGDLSGAQAAVQQALAHTGRESDPYTRVRLYWSLARLAEFEGRGVTALAYVRRAIALLEATDDTLHLARAHQFSARILLLPGGDLDKAEAELERADELFGKHASAADTAGLRTDQAWLAAQQGHGEDALELAQEALALIGELDPSERGRAWRAAAEAYVALGRIDEADGAFRRAAGLLAEHGHARERVEVHRAWGRALASAGREDAAAEVLGLADR
jgi:tetratricopeptide (TPR) repeat protein